jgi:hypothetical protein
MKIETDQYELRVLLNDHIRLGRLALPEFQRPFKWLPGQIAELLRTVVRKWPPGSFLLMRLRGASEMFELRNLEKARPLDKGNLSFAILDGQQRMTSLFQALMNQADEVYYIDMRKVLKASAFDDDDLKYMGRAAFAKAYPTLEAMAAKGIAPVYQIWDDQAFDNWKAHLPEEERGRMLKLREEVLPGLRDYDIPVVILPDDSDFGAVAKIFETINKTGTKLDTFDLMVARLIPKGFKLRDEWQNACANYPLLAKFKVEGLDVLRLIALRAHLAGEPNVSGVRASDVLNLKPEAVITRWPEAAAAFERTLRFLSDRIGAVRDFLVPSWTMVLPLADALFDPKVFRKDWDKDLERWLWNAALSNQYSQGANTQAVADARSLRAWHVDTAAVPAVVSSSRFYANALLDDRRRNESVLRALMCLLIKGDARDWMTDELIRDSKDELEIHHIFPEKFLEARGVKAPDILSNFAVVNKATNASLRNDTPSDVLKRGDVNKIAIQSHRVPMEPMTANDWERFLAERTKLLADALSARGIQVVTAPE